MSIRSPLLFSLSTLLLLSACGSDPVAQDAADYSAAMEPVMQANAALGAEFLTLATKVNGEELPPDKVGRRWNRKVLPAAEQVVVSAQQVQPTSPQLVELHTELTQSWQARLEAYQAIDAAWTAGDPAAMKIANQSNVQAKLAEEAALARTNALLAGYDLYLDPFPDL